MDRRGHSSNGHLRERRRGIERGSRQKLAFFMNCPLNLCMNYIYISFFFLLSSFSIHLAKQSVQSTVL